jgi:hypothetical protein
MFIYFELFVMYVLTLVVHSLYITGDRTKDGGQPFTKAGALGVPEAMPS